MHADSQKSSPPPDSSQSSGTLERLTRLEEEIHWSEIHPSTFVTLEERLLLV